jgi:hypothetical protein
VDPPWPSCECAQRLAHSALSGIRVARELDRLVIKLQAVISNNGSQLICNAILALGRADHTMSTALHGAGQSRAECLYQKLQQPLRNESLSETLFTSPQAGEGNRPPGTDSCATGTMPALKRFRILCTPPVRRSFLTPQYLHTRIAD